MTGAGRMAMDSAFAADVLPPLSLTVTLKLKGLPAAVVGVPLIAPVSGLSVRPGGSDPLLIVQLVYGGDPPDAARVCE
jgi:hypothetical protein